MRTRTHRRDGMTLIEILIVITIMAMAAAAASYGLGAITKSKLRAASMRVVSAARYARHRALTTNKTVRVVMDLDQGSLGIEESNGRVTLNGEESDDEEDRVEAVDAWETAQQLVSHPDVPALGASMFSPVVDDDGDPIERCLERPLDGIRVVRFHSPHDVAPREHGRVAMYFFPNGTGERVYVVLADGRENKITVELDGLTGRPTLHTGALDPARIRSRSPRDPG